MTILHYIDRDKTSASITETYMPALARCMAETAGCNIALSLKEMKEQAKKARPDIVHIHSCWSISAWRAERWCLKNRIPVVLSPHRKLEPWHVAHNYWHLKLPMLLLFQRMMIKKAKAIHTTTTQEQKNILLIDYHPDIKSNKAWNKRVVTVKNSLTDGNTTDSQMALEMKALYQKIIDSYPFLAMSEKEKAAENALLRRGLAKDDASAKLPKEAVETIYSLTADSWRKILLHSSDEGITEEILKGISTMNLRAQDISGIKRFESEKPKNLEPLRGDRASRKRLRLNEIADEERASADDIRLCTMFINLRQEIRKGTISKRHVADLYKAIRFTNCDEDKVETILKRLGIRKFCARMLQIIKETLGLEEGFTPFEPINDRGTTKIKNILLKTDIQ